MKRSLLGLALLTFSLAACVKQPVAVPLKPPAERLVCAPAGARPSVPAEYVIDWNAVTTVAQARIEHDAFVRVLRSREGIITGYLVAIEGKLFACSTNAAWLRDFYEPLPSK